MALVGRDARVDGWGDKGAGFRYDQGLGPGPTLDFVWRSAVLLSFVLDSEMDRDRDTNASGLFYIITQID